MQLVLVWYEYHLTWVGVQQIVREFHSSGEWSPLEGGYKLKLADAILSKDRKISIKYVHVNCLATSWQNSTVLSSALRLRSQLATFAFSECIEMFWW